MIKTMLQKLSFILFCVLGLQFATAQLHRFKAENISVITRTEKGEWSKWSKPEPSSLLITVDEAKNRIVIHSQDIQVYTILSADTKDSTADDEVQTFECADLEGGACTILFLMRKKQNNRMQCYVNFNDIRFVYNVTRLEEPVAEPKKQ